RLPVSWLFLDALASNLDHGHMLNGFSHVMIYVHDLERAAKWYSSMLGFKPLYIAAPHYASLYHEGMKFRLDLHPGAKDSPDVGHGALVYFTSEKLDDAVAALRGKGVSV